MKKLILLLSLFYSSLAQSQIQKTSTSEKTVIGKVVKMGGVFVAELSYSIANNDTSYLILYNDMKYQTITSIEDVEFKGSNTLNELYSTLKSIFKSGKTSFKLGEQNVSVLPMRNSIVLFIDKGNGGTGELILTEKELDKLFNKN